MIIRKIKSEEGERQYSAVETKTPHFNQLKSNLERSASKPKDSDEKKKAVSPAPPSTISKPSGGPRKSWVLNSSDPQTKPFDEKKSVVEESDEKPKTGNPKPEDDAKIYSVKENPYVRGNTPTKTSKVTISESRIYKSIDER